MRFFTLLLVFGLFTACQNSESTNEPTTGNLLEIEPDQTELDEIALVNQPQIVQDFFAVGEEIFGERLCYNYESISQLILHGNDSNGEWNKFEINDNYLTIHQEECDVLLEFMTFELSGSKKAFLSQMNRGTQQFNYLRWNETKNSWTITKNYPKPEKAAYFSNVSEESIAIINEYGADFIYINPQDKSATFVFSEWAMSSNMGEKQLLEFKDIPVYDFVLSTATGSFALDTIVISPEESIESEPLL